MYETLFSGYEMELGQGRTLDDIVSWIEELPPMPEVIMRALRILDDPNRSPDEAADVIMRDPASTALILRAANSAVTGRERPANTLGEAIQIVGIMRVKAILMASALRRWNRNFGRIERLAYEKALGASFAARIVCERLKKKYRDELNLTALLHNLGQIALLTNKNFARTYPDVLSRIREHHEDFIVAERSVIGFSHPLVGALVAKKWQLPPETCRAILHCADSAKSIQGAANEKLAALKLAVIVGLACGMGCPEGYAADPEEMKVLSHAMGFAPETWQADLEVCASETKNLFKSEAAGYGG